MTVFYQNVEIDLSDIPDDDLIEELEYRSISTSVDSLNLADKTLINDIWLKRRMGKDYQADLDQLIYNFIGKII